MCSTCDDCDVKATIVNEPNQVKRCRKCNSERAFIVLDKIHVDCQKCFLESCNRKIRSTIGKSKLLKNNDPILIAFSGGPSSLALLDLMKNSMEFEARREQKFRPSIVHIDTQSVLDRNMESLRARRWHNIDELLAKTSLLCPGWPIYYTSVEMLFKCQPCHCNADGYEPKFSRYELHSKPNDFILGDSNALANFWRNCDKLDNLTDKQHFVQTSIIKLLSEISGEINSSFVSEIDKFRFVLVGSSASQLANDLLVNVILGHGSTIRSTVSVCDDRNRRAQVALMRPMRDFSKKEILFYLRARNIEHNYRVEPNLITFADCKSSIQTLTEAFVGKLQLDYPSTCSTLLRTGNKMQD